MSDITLRVARRLAVGALLGATIAFGPGTVPTLGHDLPDRPDVQRHYPYLSVKLGAEGPRAGLRRGPSRGSPASTPSRGAPSHEVPDGSFGNTFGQVFEVALAGALENAREGAANPTHGNAAAGLATLPSWAALAALDRTSPLPEAHPVSAAYGIAGSWAAGHHTGVDFATPVGTPVHSVGPGTVVLAGSAGDYGEAAMVALTDGYYALYAHLSSVDVVEGERVQTGTPLGETGNTGNSTGPHLHFEIRTGETYGTDVDPVAHLARHGVSLD
ncbi:M23 family metallopeptidase [Streptomyces sp. 4N509B]|uniref:M23 family metallopeptidase n=1 Tax=Streptomyces sp. 4N509B TaxID=3457413 RepID=UPI003FD13329